MNAKKIAALTTASALVLGAKAETNDWHVSGYGSFDFASGYVLYGARENDEPCYWTYGELNLAWREACSAGIWLWQNTDMTCRRKASMRRMNEWDWGTRIRGTFALAENWSANAEFGHIWYKYHTLRSDAKTYYKTMEEWYARFSLDNPFLTPYFECAYDHKVHKGAFMQGGLRRDIPLPGDLVLTPDFTLGGGTRNYNACLYPPFDGSVGSGLTYAQLAFTLSRWFNAHIGIHARIAYAVTLNGDIRQATDDIGDPYAKDLVWGTIGVDFAF